MSFKKFWLPDTLPTPQAVANSVLSRRKLLVGGASALGVFLAAPHLSWANKGNTSNPNQKTELQELMILALQHEHGAFVQYSNHTGLLSLWLERDVTSTYKSIISDEVQHAIVLVQALQASGAEPTLAVWPARSGDAPEVLLQQDIAAEENAVDIYQQILELNPEAGLQKEIESIKESERGHQEIFESMLQEIS